MIIRDGRGARLDVGPGDGRMSHQVGEGVTSLLDGPGPVALPPDPAAPVGPMTQRCSCGGSITVLDGDVEASVRAHYRTREHVVWRRANDLQTPRWARKPAIVAEPRPPTLAAVLPVDELYLLDELGPDLAHTFGIRPFHRKR